MIRLIFYTCNLINLNIRVISHVIHSWRSLHPLLIFSDRIRNTYIHIYLQLELPLSIKKNACTVGERQFSSCYLASSVYCVHNCTRWSFFLLSFGNWSMLTLFPCSFSVISQLCHCYEWSLKSHTYPFVIMIIVFLM